jgi:transcriptional regulator with XRE-family HTH domain
MLLRNALGETLRHARIDQSRTLRDVSTVANVSLGYLSEVERGRKEASSELLAAICDALDLQVSDVLDDASTAMRVATTAGRRDAGTLRLVMPYRPAPSQPSVV